MKNQLYNVGINPLGGGQARTMSGSGVWVVPVSAPEHDVPQGLDWRGLDCPGGSDLGRRGAAEGGGVMGKIIIGFGPVGGGNCRTIDGQLGVYVVPSNLYKVGGVGVYAPEVKSWTRPVSVGSAVEFLADHCSGHHDNGLVHPLRLPEAAALVEYAVDWGLDIEAEGVGE